MSTDIEFGVAEAEVETETTAEDLASQYSASNDSLVDESTGGEAGEETVSAKSDEEKLKDTPAPLSRQDWADYGLTEEVARELDAKGSLGITMDAMDRRFLAIGEEAMKAAETPPGPVKAAENPEEKAADEKPAAGPFKLNLDAEVYDEGLVKELTGFVDHLNRQHSEMSKMATMLAEVMQTTQTHAKSLADQRQVAFEERMDVWFNSQGEEYKDLLGTGTVHDMAPSSPQFKKRAEIVRTMDVLASGYERVGAPVPAEAVLRDRAARLVLGDRAAEVARKQVAAEVKKVQGQLLSKPTHREGKPVSGMDKAVRRVEKFFRDKGLN